MGFFPIVIFRAKGFATLAAVGLLVLTAALLAGAVLGSQQLITEQGRVEKGQAAKAEAWTSVQALLTALQGSWNADDQSLDNWWSRNAGAFPKDSELVSLSARVNLNSATPFLLQDSELLGTLQGKSVEDFTTYRANKGPFAEIDGYKNYFQAAALNGLYCVLSFFNINTADEIMLEKLTVFRTGNEAIASTIRSRVREFRANRQMLAQSDLDTLLGGEKEVLGDLLTVDPELDVNTAPVPLLQALLRDPDMKLAAPDAKLQVLVSGRAARPWNVDSLRAALGVDKNSLLLQYLGTRCRFIQGKVPEGTAAMSFVAIVGYSTDSPPKLTIRILDTRWTSS